MSYRFTVARGVNHRSVVVKEGPPFQCPFCFHGTLPTATPGATYIGRHCDRCNAKLTDIEEFNEQEE